MPRVEKVTSKKVATASPKGGSRNDKMSVPVYSLAGRAAGVMALPKEIFGAKVNKALLTQAMRVYMNNQKSHQGHTKTRGEVTGSTVKIYRQKGTGRARHGSIRAPIFVGGGIAFGPTHRKVILDLPKKMKKAALISALSSKMADKNITGVSGLEKISGKTKEVFSLVEKINPGKSTLIVTGDKQETIVRAVRNLAKVHVMQTSQLNAYEVLRHQNLLVTKGAVETLRQAQGKN